MNAISGNLVAEISVYHLSQFLIVDCKISWLYIFSTLQRQN